MSSVRRFGRYDDFHPTGSATSSVGSKSFGKITIDCQLLFNKSKWGILEGLPGGIMYLNLNFGPPQGSKLQEATITVTLDEQDARLESYNRDLPLQILHHSGAPVQVTEWYGPGTLRGEKKSAMITSTMKAVPQASVFGNSVGGLGHERSKQYVKESRWSFNGQMIRGNKTSTYTTLKWHLTENELEGQAFHNPKIRTAFSFKHSGQAFIMKVEIKGRLRNWQDKVQSKLRFGVDGAREGKVVTLVDFEDYQKFSHRLDGIARGLPRAMEMENFEDIPMEVPDSIPGVSFQQVPSLHSSLHDCESQPQALSPEGTRPLLQDLDQTSTVHVGPTNTAKGLGLAATVHAYKRVLAPLSTLDTLDLAHALNGKVSPLISTGTTLFADENETVKPDKVQEAKIIAHTLNGKVSPLISTGTTLFTDENETVKPDKVQEAKIIVTPRIIADESRSDRSDAVLFEPNVGVLRLQVLLWALMQLFSIIKTLGTRLLTGKYNTSV